MPSFDEHPPICKDCEHCIPYANAVTDGARWRLAECGKSAKIAHIVSGEVRHRFCEWMRSESGECGPTGKLFQPDNCDVCP